MGLGVLEDTKLTHVPGTVLLNDEAAHSESVTGGLKHGTGRNAHIVLAPQPSEDVNDPLNWQSWKKELCLVVLVYGSMLNAATIGPLLNSSLVVIATSINASVPAVVLISGYNLLAVGCTGPFYCALSRRYGKRPIFLVATLFAIVGNALGEVATTYNMLLASRIIQGFATSPYESLIIAAVGDMFFVHQRGLRVAFITFILNASSSLASIIAGQITTAFGWNWLFHMLQIFTVVQFILMFLFCPETTYHRDHIYDIDQVQDEKFAELSEVEHRHDNQKELSETRANEASRIQSVQATLAARPKKTFLQSMAVYTGVHSHDNILKLLVGPFVTLLNLGACWSTVCSGLLTMWYVTSAIVQAGIFAGPPWFFDAAQVGYLSTGPFVGGMVGSILIAATTDPLVKWMTKKNKGIYEPEFRLVHMAPATVLCAIGMFCYGWFTQIGASAYVCAFFQGVMMCGVLLGTISSVSYALDAYRDSSNEIFIMNMLFKNFLFYGISNVSSQWVENDGPFDVLAVCGSTSAFLCALALPVYIYGKKLRSYWTRHNLLVKWGMQSSVQMEMGG